VLLSVRAHSVVCMQGQRKGPQCRVSKDGHQHKEGLEQSCKQVASIKQLSSLTTFGKGLYKEAEQLHSSGFQLARDTST